jgi:hypothetical protein
MNSHNFAVHLAIPASAWVPVIIIIIIIIKCQYIYISVIILDFVIMNFPNNDI